MLSKSLFRDEIPALFDCQRRVVAGPARDAVGHYDRGGRRLSVSGQTKQALRMLNSCLPSNNTGGSIGIRVTGVTDTTNFCAFSRAIRCFLPVLALALTFSTSRAGGGMDAERIATG